MKLWGWLLAVAAVHFVVHFVSCFTAGPMKITPSQIEQFIAERLECRQAYNYDRADEIMKYLEGEGIQLNDIPRKQGGGTTWKYIIDKTKLAPSFTIDGAPTKFMDCAHDAFALQEKYGREAFCKLAKALLVSASPDCDMNSMTDEMKEDSTVLYSSEREMQGRKFSDACFEFSMAGVEDSELYAMLLRGASTELKRYGARNSCRPVDICHVVEKFAVAGCRNIDLYGLAADILEEKVARIEKGAAEARGSAYWDTISALRSGQYSLLSERPLRWLWRYAIRQAKYGKQIIRRDEKTAVGSLRELGDEGDVYDDDDDDDCRDNNDHDANGGHSSHGHSNEHGSDSPARSSPRVERDAFPPFQSLFADPTLPLIVDLGCGYGVSILGLAYDDMGACTNDSSNMDATNNGCNTPLQQTQSTFTGLHDIGQRFNYLGCDMSPRSVAYANSVSMRWGMAAHCRFVISDAQTCMHRIRSEYAASIAVVMINFPTPYKFDTIESGTDDVANLPVEKTSNAGSHTAHPETEVHAKKQCLREERSPDDRTRSSNEPHIGVPVSNCNSQLPRDLSTFMVSPELVALIQDAFQHSRDQHSRSDDHARKNQVEDTHKGVTKSYLYIQSNVEDVAVTVKEIVENVPPTKDGCSMQVPACANFLMPHLRNRNPTGETSLRDRHSKHMKGESRGNSEADTKPLDNEMNNFNMQFTPKMIPWTTESHLLKKKVTTKSSASTLKATKSELTRRQQKWIDFGGARACGNGFLSESPLPKCARTETEVGCEVEGKPVHRVLFEFGG